MVYKAKGLIKAPRTGFQPWNHWYLKLDNFVGQANLSCRLCSSITGLGIVVPREMKGRGGVTDVKIAEVQFLAYEKTQPGSVTLYKRSSLSLLR